MKYPNTCFAMLALVALAPAGLPTASAQTSTRDPIVITPPAVQSGSNWSRAPFPAARQRDDIHHADGNAVDLNVPPNTPASDPEPNPLPEPTVAIFQPAAAPAAVYATTTSTEPYLTPTGRPTIGLSTASAQTSTRDPVVITPPAVQSGSNWSRAPFPAARQRDDIHHADGNAVDLNVPPNTPASDPEPNPLPEPTVAIFQPAPAPAAVYATTPVVAEPALTPTGRPTTGLAVALDANQTVAAINAGAFASREQLAADIESRMKAVDTAMKSMRGTTREMSGDMRTQFKAAEDEIKQAERALRNSLRAARRASATEWDSARAQLASDFQAYASALQRLDAAAGVR